MRNTFHFVLLLLVSPLGFANPPVMPMQDFNCEGGDLNSAPVSFFTVSVETSPDKMLMLNVGDTRKIYQVLFFGSSEAAYVQPGAHHFRRIYAHREGELLSVNSDAYSPYRAMMTITTFDAHTHVPTIQQIELSTCSYISK